MGNFMKSMLTTGFAMLVFFGTIIAVLFGWSLIIALPVKWLWNYLCPTLFSLPAIGYWQAFCLLLLTGLLFRANINKNSKDEK